MILRRILLKLRRRSRLERDMEAELAFHRRAEPGFVLLVRLEEEVVDDEVEGVLGVEIAGPDVIADGIERFRAQVRSVVFGRLVLVRRSHRVRPVREAFRRGRRRWGRAPGQGGAASPSLPPGPTGTPA